MPGPDRKGVVLAVRGLSAAWEGVPLFNNVTMDLATGDVLYLQGENGAGKSTLLRCLCGLKVPESGEIIVKGERILPGSAALAHVSAALHESMLHPALTLADNLDLFGRLAARPRDDRWREQVFQSLAIAPLLHQRCGEFSRGQSQRATLARALLPQKPLLLLDEPFNGLDRAGVAGLTSLLEAMRAGGCGIVMTCHEPSLVATLATRLLTMQRGDMAGAQLS